MKQEIRAYEMRVNRLGTSIRNESGYIFDSTHTSKNQDWFSSVEKALNELVNREGIRVIAFTKHYVTRDLGDADHYYLVVAEKLAD